MEIVDYPLTCNRIGKISMKNEGSDFVVLPAHLKPRKPNVFEYYVFKISSDLSTRWTYCRVASWTADEKDCYIPVWMMNYLHIPDKCEAKFSFGDFSIKKAESLVIQPTDEIFASYSFLVELSALRSALRSYTTLTNNSFITLTVDGQKFSVIVRLLRPEEKVRTTPNMDIVVSKNIYVRDSIAITNQRKRGGKVVDESKKYEDMNISEDVDMKELLGGLCSRCYHTAGECKCDSIPITAVNRSAQKEKEEESRRIALDTLQDLYCMNCFKLHVDCQCPKVDGMLELNNSKPVKTTEVAMPEEEEEEEINLEEEDFDIMKVVEQEMQQAIEQRKQEAQANLEKRQKELEAKGHSKEEALEVATAEIENISEGENDMTMKEEEEVEEASEEKKPLSEEPRIEVTEADVDAIMEPIENKKTIFYYWPIKSEEHSRRWLVENAVLIPPPPPDDSEKKNRNKISKKNGLIWSFLKRSGK